MSSTTPTKPSGSPRPKVDSSPSKSVISASQELASQITKMLQENSKPAVTGGVDIVYIAVNDLDELSDKLEALISDGKPHTISVKDYSDLSQQVAALKLDLVNSGNTVSDLTKSKALLEKDLKKAQENLANADKSRDLAISSLELSKNSIKVAIAEKRAIQDDLNAKILASKAQKDFELTSRMSALKEENASELSRLNNLAQGLNADIRAEREKVVRLEKATLALTVSLNMQHAKLQRAVAREAPVKTLAQIAAEAGTAAVNLVNSAYSNLRDTSREDLQKAKASDPDDVKNKVFWLKAAVDHSKHAIYNPYRVVLGGVLDDLKHIAYQSRLPFLKFADGVLESLSATGRPLTIEEMTALLNEVDPAAVLLTKEMRKPGMKTLLDFIKKKSTDSANEKPESSAKGKERASEADTFLSINSKRTKPLILKKKKGAEYEIPKKSRKASVESVADYSDANSDLNEIDPIPEPDDSGKGRGRSNFDDDPSDHIGTEDSLYSLAKSWFKKKRFSFRKRVVSSLKKSKARLVTFYRLSTGNFFQRMLSVPYSWLIMVF